MSTDTKEPTIGQLQESMLWDSAKWSAPDGYSVFYKETKDIDIRESKEKHLSLVVNPRNKNCGSRVYYIPKDLTETEARGVTEHWAKFVQAKRESQDPYYNQPYYNGTAPKQQPLVRIKFVHDGYVGPALKADELKTLVIEDILCAFKENSLPHYLEEEKFDGTVEEYSYPGCEDDVEESDE